MHIRSFCAIPIKIDEPVAAVRQFVSTLRRNAVPTPKSKIDINLLGVSARAKATIREFNPARTRAASFDRALKIVEELEVLPAAQIKGLNIHLSAEEFAWKGANSSTTASLLLADSKAFRQKQRFTMTAMMDLHAERPGGSEVAALLAAVLKATGLKFMIDASVVHFDSGDRQQATPQQLLVVQLVWNELISMVGDKLRPVFKVKDLPQLMSSQESIAYRFDPAKLGKAVRVDFRKSVQRWFKQNFADYQAAGGGEHPGIRKTIAANINLCLHFDKAQGSFSKNYSAYVGVEFTGPQFAVLPDRPYKLQSPLFEPFELFMYEWAYSTEDDLQKALDGSRTLIRDVLTLMEREGRLPLQNVLARELEEFEAPREITARQAWLLVHPQAKAWAADAELEMLQLGAMISNPHAPVASLARSSGKGRLGPNGQWRLVFQSGQKQRNLQFYVPWRGAIRRAEFAGTRQIIPLQTFDDGWLDSAEALERALAKAGGLGLTEPEPGQLEMRTDHHFGRAWHISFAKRQDNGALALIHVTVPPYGDRGPDVKVNRFGKNGMPITNAE